MTAVVKAAVAEDVHRDVSMFNVVNPANAKYDEKQAFVVCKSNPQETFTVTTPPMRSMYAEDVGEGNLGVLPKYKNAKAVTARADARYTLKFAIGGKDMDDTVAEEMPTLIEDQLKYFQVVYQAAVAALTSAYEINPGMFGELYTDAAAKAYTKEITREETYAEAKGVPPKYKTTKELIAYMKNDVPTESRVKAFMLTEFLDAAKLPPNPANYDEEGVKLRNDAAAAKEEDEGDDEKVSYMMHKFSRLVFKQKGKYVKGKAKPDLTSFTALASTPETWPTILAEAEKSFVWQPYRYFDGATGKELVRPKYLPPGETDPKKMVPDFMWSPLNNCLSLIAGSTMLQVWATAAGYGVRLVGNANITVIRQAPFTRQGKVVMYKVPGASGVLKRDREEEPVAPVAKKLAIEASADDGGMSKEEQEEALE